MRINRQNTIPVISIVLVMLSVLVYRHVIGISQVRDSAEIASLVASSWDSQNQKSDPNFRKLSARLSQASSSLERAQNNMTPGLQIADSMRWFPSVGDRLGAAIDLMSVADDVFVGGQILSDVAVILDESQFLYKDEIDGLPTIDPVLILHLQSERANLLEAQTRFAAARVKLSDLTESDAGLEYLASSVDIGPAIDLMDSLIGLSLLVADHGDELLGFSGDSRYVIMALNADELRAGGGFSPGLWDVQITNGKLLETNFYDAFEIGAAGGAPPTPPIDMLRSMWAGGWFIPDAAWYPDTDRTTSYVTNMIEQSLGIDDASAVVYVDQWAALSFIEAAGEVTLDDGRFVDSNSFFEFLQERTDVEGRKYLSTLFDGLLNSISADDAPSAAAPLLLTLFESLESRHMQIRFSDQQAQSQYENAGFGDVLAHEQDSDFLFVADANVGFSKVNRNVSRELLYELDFDDPSDPTARLTISHRNRSEEQEDEDCTIQDARVAGSVYADSLNACFWNLSQVYTHSSSESLTFPSFPMPEGALYRTVGYDDVEETLRVENTGDFQVVSGLYTVPSGEMKSHVYEYDLSPEIIAEKNDRLEYNLRVPKQPGLRRSTAIIDVTMPDGFGLRFSDPLPLLVSNGRALFEQPQDSDLEFKMVFTTADSSDSGRIVRSVPDVPESSPSVLADVSVFGVQEQSQLTSARISPSVLRVAPGESVDLRAFGVDQNGRKMDGTSTHWALVDPQAGSIDRFGVFSASEQTGVFRGAVSATVTLTDAFGSSSFADFATVEIFDPELDLLDSVIAYPPEIRVLSEQVVSLRAIPWTVGGRIAKDTRVTWRVNDEAIGTVDSFGFLHVEAVPGIYTNSVTAIATQPGRGGQPDLVRETNYTFVVPSIDTFDAMARAIVLPRSANLRAGQSFRFISRAFTDRADTAENVEWSWSLSDPSLGTIDDSGVFTATESVGSTGAEGVVKTVATQRLNGQVYEVESFSSINLLPPVIFQELDFAQITSGTVETSVGDRVLLTASGYSVNGFRIPNLTRQWIVVDPRAGRIQSGALFIAGRSPGIYEDALQLRLSQRTEDGDVIVLTATADIVIASEATSVVIGPIPSPLARGQSVKLNAVAFDEDGREVRGAAFIWHVMDPEAGVMRPGGIFTAGIVESDFSEAVRVYIVRGR